MIPIIFFVSLGVLIVSIATAFINIGSGRPNFMLHAICAFLSWIGGLGFTITGIIWLVTFIIEQVKAA